MYTIYQLVNNAWVFYSYADSRSIAEGIVNTLINYGYEAKYNVSSFAISDEVL